MLMDGIWDLIYNSRKHIWHQLHTLNGTVVNLVDPPKEWRFLSSGKYFKINVKVGKHLKHFFPYYIGDDGQIFGLCFKCNFYWLTKYLFLSRTKQNDEYGY